MIARSSLSRPMRYGKTVTQLFAPQPSLDRTLPTSTPPATKAPLRHCALHASIPEKPVPSPRGPRRRCDAAPLCPRLRPSEVTTQRLVKRRSPRACASDNDCRVPRRDRSKPDANRKPAPENRALATAVQSWSPARHGDCRVQKFELSFRPFQLWRQSSRHASESLEARSVPRRLLLATFAAALRVLCG